MIPAGVDIFLAIEPVDMRCGFNRLSGIAREHLGYDPRCGAMFVFYGKRRDSVKILFFDGSGMCLYYKKLDKARFRIPDVPDAQSSHVELDEADLEVLLEGVEVARRRSKRTVH